MSEPQEAVGQQASAAVDVRAVVASLPRRPGVYRMYDAAGNLIYVGKAARLRDRVASYFSARPLAPKVAAMVRRIASLEVTVVNSETEALLLECNLIKAHRPRYNIILRDDKTYPYIVRPEGHDFPRLVYWRGPRRPPGQLFGPFPNATAAREVLQTLQKVFRIRNCRDAFFAHRSRPCLQHQIGRCSGPCVGLIAVEVYRRDVDAAVKVLEGRSEDVAVDLQQRMEAAAVQRDYEQAASLRDQLAGLKEIQTRQIASAPRPRDLDAIAIVGDPGQYGLAVLTVRDGQVLGTASHVATNLAEADETLAAFLVLHYGRQSVPAEIATNVELADVEAVTSALAGIAGRGVNLYRPARGLPTRWVAMAEDNARQALKMHAARTTTFEEAGAALAQALQLAAAPARIECFDISHTAGEGTVASCVVFGPDGPEKRHYRRFNIEGITPGDDYAALQQALLRHGRRIVGGESPRPDLLLIDGGAAQVDAAGLGLAAAGCEGLQLLGISKGPDRRPGQEQLHRPGSAVALVLAPDSPALHLLQRVRDEAHRFAITGHRRRRARRFSESVLESIAGLGKTRRRALLTHFGGLQGVLRASAADLEQAPGIGPSMARTIYDHLHPGE
jgi:excinuclease ABC subunit C